MGIPRILKRARGSKSQHEDRHRWLALPALRPQSDPARNRDAVLGSLTGSKGKMSTHRQTKRRSFYQISTSTALVEGVHSGSVSSSVLLEHGDFGLGTRHPVSARSLPLETGAQENLRFSEISAFKTLRNK